MRSFDVLKKKYAFYLGMLSSSFLLPHTKNPNTLDTTEPCPVPVCRIKKKQKRTPVMLPCFLPQCNNTHKYDFVLF
jgi:hypothetical protein